MLCKLNIDTIILSINNVPHFVNIERPIGVDLPLGREFIDSA